MTLSTCSLAKYFLLGTWDSGRVASWHLAVHDEALTIPQHRRVTLGILVKITPLFIKHVLDLWVNESLASEPALWRVDLRLRRTPLAPQAIRAILSDVIGWFLEVSWSTCGLLRNHQ